MSDAALACYPVPWANGPAESFMVSPAEVRSLAESVGFMAEEWLEGAELVARIGATAQSGRPGMAGGVDGVTLPLLMPDFDERMAALARNVEEQRVGLIMAVFSKPGTARASSQPRGATLAPRR